MLQGLAGGGDVAAAAAKPAGAGGDGPGGLPRGRAGSVPVSEHGVADPQRFSSDHVGGLLQPCGGVLGDGPGLAGCRAQLAQHGVLLGADRDHLTQPARTGFIVGELPHTVLLKGPRLPQLDQHLL